MRRFVARPANPVKGAFLPQVIQQIHDALSIPLPLAFALTAAAMASVGVVVAALNQSLALRLSSVLEIVAGGLLLGVTSTHLARHALDDGVALGASMMLCGALAGYLIGLWGTHEHGADSIKDSARSAGLTSLLAIAVHSLLDGGVYVASLQHDHAGHGGAAAGAGLILHEGAEGVIAFFLSLKFLRKTRSALIAALLAAAATTPAGTLIALWVGDLVGPSFLHVAFPLAAGFVGYAGLALLWPHVRRWLALAGVRQRPGERFDDGAD